MPAHDGLGLDDNQGIRPAIEDGAQSHPEQSVAAPEVRPGAATFEQSELLAQGENLQTEVVAGAKEAEWGTRGQEAVE